MIVNYETIMPWEDSKLEQVCSLLDRFLGDGFHPLEDYVNYDPSVDIVQGIWVDSQLVAAATSGLVRDKLDYLDSYFLDSVKNPGWVESCAVEEEYRGYGFGKTLIQCAINFLVDKNIKDILALCWISGLERQSLQLFQSLGFYEVEHFIEPWIGENCPVCGTDCTCDATLVYKGF